MRRWVFAVTGEAVQHQGEPLRLEAPAHVTWSESGDHAYLVALERAANDHDRSALMVILREQGGFVRIDRDVSTDRAGWLPARGLNDAGCGIKTRRRGPRAGKADPRITATTGWSVRHSVDLG